MLGAGIALTSPSWPGAYTHQPCPLLLLKNRCLACHDHPHTNLLDIPAANPIQLCSDIWAWWGS